MELNPEQIEKFKKIHKKCGGLNSYPENEIKEIANGVVNLFLSLSEIYQKNEKRKRKLK